MPISNPVYSLQGQSEGTAAIDTVTDPLQIVGTDLSIKDASTVQKGAVQLVSDISDITSPDKAPTVSYIKELINNSLINPNNLANVDFATLTNIALTGGVTYLGQVIPTNSRVLVTGQTDATTNGIYLSNDGGAWARTTDADTIEKLYLSQTISLNATKGLYLCTIPKDAVLGVSAITFIQLYQTNDDTIGVRLYQPSTIYNVNDLVVNPSVDEFIFKCLVNGTNNIPPSMASANWEIYQGLLYANSAVVTSNGDDNKTESFPYLTYTGAIFDMLIGAYIEGRAVTNTETITPKQGMKLSGKNVQVNNLIVNVNDVKCDGIIFANTIGTAAGMSVTGTTNSQFINCSVSNGANAYAINLGGTWDGIHKFLNLNVTGNIQVVGTTATGVVYFENINNALTLTLNCTNAKVYISNCPNITIVNTLSGSVTVDGVLNPIANDIVTIDANLQQKDSGKKFSIDGTFAADSDNNISTEKAIKAYVDSLFPVGKIEYFANTVNFNKRLVLNNQAVSRTTYAALFALWGTTYGIGDGVTTFNVPDMRDKVLGMAGSSHSIGTSAGTETTTGIVNHTHTLEHTHSINHDHGSFNSGSAGDASIPNGGFGLMRKSSGEQDTITATDRSPGEPDLITSPSGWSHDHTVDVPNFTGTSGNASTATTSTTGTGATVSLLQPTGYIGSWYVYAGV